jgi:hypothetical protein
MRDLGSSFNEQSNQNLRSIDHETLQSIRALPNDGSASAIYMATTLSRYLYVGGPRWR